MSKRLDDFSKLEEKALNSTASCIDKELLCESVKQKKEAIKNGRVTK